MEIYWGFLLKMSDIVEEIRKMGAFISGASAIVGYSIFTPAFIQKLFHINGEAARSLPNMSTESLALATALTAVVAIGLDKLSPNTDVRVLDAGIIENIAHFVLQSLFAVVKPEGGFLGTRLPLGLFIKGAAVLGDCIQNLKPAE